MKYYIKETQIDVERQKTAGVKARNDLESIFEDVGIKRLDMPVLMEKNDTSSKLAKLKNHRTVYKTWKKIVGDLKSGDQLYVQFPVLEHSLFLHKVFNKLNKSGVEVILIIHDLELLRNSQNKNSGFSKRMRIKLEESNILKVATKVISHNQRMTDYLADNVIDKEKIINLEIFDYLIDDFEQRSGDMHDRICLGKPLIIAGNLRPKKAKYVYDLPNNIDFNLFGIGYEGVDKPNEKYFGSFLPEELPFALVGSFGVVWDGETSETCSGIFGEYLRINNPHKTSLYLASDIPVLIWKEAALAEFIQENGCGIVVDSIYDAKDAISKLSYEEYATMQANAAKVGKRLRSGYYTRKAIS